MNSVAFTKKLCGAESGYVVSELEQANVGQTGHSQKFQKQDLSDLSQYMSRSNCPPYVKHDPGMRSLTSPMMPNDAGFICLREECVCVGIQCGNADCTISPPSNISIKRFHQNSFVPL